MKLKLSWMKKNSARKPKDDLQISKKQKIQQKRKAAKKLQRQQKIAKNRELRKQKQEEKRPTIKYAYSIKPRNVLYQNEKKRHSIASRWERVIKSAKSGCIIEMYRVAEEILVGSKKDEFTFNKIILHTADEIDNRLIDNGFKFVKFDKKNKDDNDRPTMSGKYMKTGDMHSECFALYSMSQSLPLSWIANDVFSHCDFVRIFVKQVRPQIKKKILHRINVTQKERAIDENVDNSGMLNEIKNRLHQRDAILLEIKIVVGVTRSNPELLKEAVKDFESWADEESAEFHRIPYAAASFFESGGPYSFHLDSHSMYPLLPFFVTDLYEPGGIILGKNIDTGTPVRYSYPRRRSFHVTFLAPSGSGKSVAMKIWVKRMLERYPDAYVFITDIENEYVNFEKELKFNIIKVDPLQSLGLDFFNYMPGYRAASTICNIVGVKGPARNILVTIGAPCKTTTEFFEAAYKYDEKNGTDYSGHLIHLTSEPIASMIAGKPQFAKRTVIAMRDALKTKSVEHKFATIASLEYVMSLATDEKIKHIPKILILDEFWSVLSDNDDDATIEYIEDIIRRGRKYNVMMLFATQNLSDVTRSEKILAMVQNSGTRVFLGQDASERDTLIDTFKLSETEADVLIEANDNEMRGVGMIHTDGENVIRIKFIANPDEIKAFFTNAVKEEDGMES